MFWPKIAGVEDAPNYRPTAGDDRCENCAYYRALNDGSGYCERFSFECEAQSVCDDYVRAGQSKISSAGISARLKEFIGNPVTKRVGVSAGTGAVVGGGTGAYNSGEDRVREGAKGALVGGTAGALIGGIGPMLRSGAKKKEILKARQKDIDSLTKEISELRSILKGVQNNETDSMVQLWERSGGKSGRDAYDHVQQEVVSLKDMLKTLKTEKPNLSVDPKEIAAAGNKERFGAPALSALVGSGLGFGVSHASKEQERYRKSRQK